jgi:hypothetical protein
MQCNVIEEINYATASKLTVYKQKFVLQYRIENNSQCRKLIQHIYRRFTTLQQNVYGILNTLIIFFSTHTH